ncbi:MAG: endonuclease III [Leptospiraceae bacterium]|nr:endonuclease III [Leptospiraceae bacterium]
MEILSNKELSKSKFTNQIYQKLKKEFGEVSCPLHYSAPHELAIAVILSAQCTDERVNLVTPKLFLEFPTLVSFAESNPKKLEELIYSTGFYRSKAEKIRGFAIMLLEEFDGVLPKTLEELTKLPGFGRKTANVILNELYGISEGIVVDTHVKRITKILGLTQNTDPEKIELDLMKVFSKKHWKDISLYLIFLGRKYCKAHARDCKNCPLRKICPGSSYE